MRSAAGSGRQAQAELAPVVPDQHDDDDDADKHDDAQDDHEEKDDDDGEFDVNICQN